jgi:hypothetical protein
MTTTTITQTTRLACAATFAALCLGATACGTEGNGATPAASINQAGGQKESRISPRAAEHQAELQEQARKLAAEHAAAERAAQGHESVEHPPGSFHSDTQCRRQGHPKQRASTCSEQASSAARPGAFKFAELLP